MTAPGNYVFVSFTMRSFGAVFVAAAASASNPSTSARGVSLKAVYNTNYEPHPASNLLATYRKHNVPVPQHLVAAASHGDTASGSTSADARDIEWLVSVRTPPQPLDLELDTGSNALWVFGDKLPESLVKDQPTYDPSKSSTSQKMPGGTWSAAYGMQSEHGDRANGSVYTDTVAIAPWLSRTWALELPRTRSWSTTAASGASWASAIKS